MAVAKEQHQGLRSRLPETHIHSPLQHSVRSRVQQTGPHSHHGEGRGVAAAREPHHLAEDHVAMVSYQDHNLDRAQLQYGAVRNRALLERLQTVHA